jgi:hypothetical protein
VRQCVRYLLTSRKRIMQLGGRSCLIFSSSLLKTSKTARNVLNETYGRGRAGKHLSDTFCVQNVLE